MVEFWGRVRAALVLSLVAFALSVPAVANAAVLQISDDAGTYGITELGAIECAFRELINEERAGEGLDALHSFDDLIDDARVQALDMSGVGYLYHNPDLAQVTTSENWFKLGEKVGYGPTVDILHDAFMESAPHAGNFLKDVYNYIGVGATMDAGGAIWVAMVFMHGPEGLAVTSEQGPDTFTVPFSDDDNSAHEEATAAIYDAGITTGCGTSDTAFCPQGLVTRAQMATFLDRALDLPETDVDAFADDDGSVHEDAINRLAAAGITLNCSDGSFCPDDLIQRAQMAALLVRALDLSGSETEYFGDDAGSPHQAAINSLAAAGVTGGCGAETCCPADEVTRAQMATFLARALNLI